MELFQLQHGLFSERQDKIGQLINVETAPGHYYLELCTGNGESWFESIRMNFTVRKKCEAVARMTGYLLGAIAVEPCRLRIVATALDGALPLKGLITLIKYTLCNSCFTAGGTIQAESILSREVLIRQLTDDQVVNYIEWVNSSEHETAADNQHHCRQAAS